MNPYIHKLNRGSFARKYNRSARVEIVSLIDVMFLLVAFFMVVSISMVSQKGIFVDLSPAQTADSSMDDSDSLVVSVDAEGSFYLNKDKISFEELEKFLLQKSSLDKDVSVVINADKGARYESVISALDIVRKSKFHNIIFSVEPRE
jgi:biopolymer transport protein ExbD